MALNASYAFLAASFSALLTGAGFAILLAKFSASFPLKTGVSLIGRAMSVLLCVCYQITKIQQISDIYSCKGDKSCNLGCKYAEFRNHKDIAKALDYTIYFANPYYSG